MTALDVSVGHPATAGTSASCLSFVHRCTAQDGAAAAARDAEKRDKYHVNACAEAFVPLSHETWGRPGKPAMRLLSLAGDAVAAGVAGLKSLFIRGELSVALCRGNERVFRMYAFNFAKVAGSVFVPGDVVPSPELG